MIVLVVILIVVNKQTRGPEDGAGGVHAHAPGAEGRGARGREKWGISKVIVVEIIYN